MTDNTEKTKTSSTLNELKNQNAHQIVKIVGLNKMIRSNGELDRQFEKKLEEKFKITRDSTTNEPKRIYNTRIGYAENVNIGSR